MKTVMKTACSDNAFTVKIFSTVAMVSKNMSILVYTETTGHQGAQIQRLHDRLATVRDSNTS